MARRKKNERVEIMRDYLIYAIISPLPENAVFISKTYSTLSRTYTEHVKLRNAKTSAHFKIFNEVNLLPPIYLLEKGRMSASEAFRRCIVWTKYFLDHEYEIISKDITFEYAMDLTEDTKELYEAVKNKPLSDVFQPEGGCLAKYKPKKTELKKKETTKVWFRLEPNEYEQIKKAASEQNLSVAGYCKRMALSGKVVSIDFADDLVKFNNSLTDIKTLLRQLILTIHRTKKYYSANIATVQDCVNKVNEIQEQLNKRMEDFIKKLWM